MVVNITAAITSPVTTTTTLVRTITTVTTVSTVTAITAMTTNLNMLILSSVIILAVKLLVSSIRSILTIM